MSNSLDTLILASKIRDLFFSASTADGSASLTKPLANPNKVYSRVELRNRANIKVMKRVIGHRQLKRNRMADLRLAKKLTGRRMDRNEAVQIVTDYLPGELLPC